MGRLLSESIAQAVSAQWRVPAVFLALLLTLTNMVILSNMPDPEGQPSAVFILAAIVRVAGLLVLSVVLIRRATASPRPAALPDGAFLFHVLLVAAGFAVAASLRLALPGDPAEPVTLVVGSALPGLVTAPFAPWMTAAATEKPLAANPKPWFRRIARWLPPLILWQVLLIGPIAALHAYINVGFVEGYMARSIWLELVDGLLSTMIALMGLALGIAAYRWAKAPEAA